MATVTNPGKHRGESAAERYGKHSKAHASLPAVEVLRRVIESGEPTRLAWQDDDSNRVVGSQEFPTAVLPVIRETWQLDVEPDEDDTEPTTATREARAWLRSDRFAWWPKSLAG